MQLSSWASILDQHSERNHSWISAVPSVTLAFVQWCKAAEMSSDKYIKNNDWGKILTSLGMCAWELIAWKSYWTNRPRVWGVLSIQRWHKMSNCE